MAILLIGLFGTLFIGVLFKSKIQRLFRKLDEIEKEVDEMDIWDRW